MAGFNRVILMGNLTQTPELRYTPQGTAVSDLRLAVSTIRGGGDNRKEDTLFIDVTAWGKQAEVICEYMQKGRSILVEGRLVQETWEDRETQQKRSKIKMVLENFQFVGGRDDGSSDAGPRRGGSERRGQGQGQGQGAPRRQQNQAPSRNVESFDEDFGGDDIPF